MRSDSVLFLLPLLLAACGEDARTLRGFLVPGSDATDVYVVGQPLRASVEADSFVIVGISGDAVELEFAENGDRLGRMRIERWSGREVTLKGIWLDDGVAFAMALDGDGSTTINGLRMVPEGALPRTVSVEGMVLAASRGAGALIVRPDDAQMPDLRVVVTPGTAIRSADGEPAEADFAFGDSLRVEGTTESGYVVATALVLLPRVPVEEAGDAEEPISEPEWDVDDDDEESEARREGPRSLQRPGGGKGRGRGLQPRRD